MIQAAAIQNQWMNQKLCTNLINNFKTCFTNHISTGVRVSGGVMMEAAVIKNQ
jgi:hypothetical protein